MGPARRARRGDGRGRLSGCSRARATRSPACRRRRRRRDGVPRRHRAARTASRVTAGGRVLCVTALGDSVKAGAAARLRGRRTASTSTARSTAATSAIARSDAALPPSGCTASDRRRRRRARLPARPAGSASSRRSRRRTATPFIARRLAAASPASALQGDGITLHRSKAARCSSAAAAASRTCAGRAAAVGDAAPARAGRRAVRGDGRLAGVPSAQPVRADGAHERAHARRAAGRRRAGVLVRRRHGPDAVLRLRGRRASLPPRLPRRAGAVRRRQVPALQDAGATSTSSSSTATSRAASAASSSTTSPSRLRAAASRMMRAVGDAFLPAYLPIVAAPQGHALRRARARLPALPARPLRRVQPGVGPRHALRPAVGRAHRDRS